MNKTISMGRLTAEPKVSVTSTGKKVARFNMALDRIGEGADFPSFVAWERKAEFVEKHCHKGKRFLVEGRIQTGSYDDKDGKKVYTTDIVVVDIEFADSKGENDGSEGQPEENSKDGFMNIPDGIDEEMPFS